MRHDIVSIFQCISSKLTSVLLSAPVCVVDSVIIVLGVLKVTHYTCFFGVFARWQDKEVSLPNLLCLCFDDGALRPSKAKASQVHYKLIWRCPDTI